MKKDSSKVSVIMSVYNEPEKMMSKSIDSILKQTFKDIEFIIINDNPENKEINKILEKYKNLDDRIIIINNNQNLGLASSLNRGLKIANGIYIARMDADDIACETRIETQYDFLEKNMDIDLVGSNVQYIDESGEIIWKQCNIRYSNDEISTLIPYTNQINHPTWMFRTNILDKLDGYRDFPSSQDYDFLLRAKYAGVKFSNLENKLLLYRIRQNSISTSKKIQQLKMTLYIQRLYRQRLKFGFDKFNKKEANRINSKKYHLFSISSKLYNYSMGLFNKKKYYISLPLIFVSVLLSKNQFKMFWNHFNIRKFSQKININRIE